MSSPLHRRSAPYVIMNNHTRSPSVAYSARPPDQEQSANSENPIQSLTEPANLDDVNVTTTSFFHLFRRAQVCKDFYQPVFEKKTHFFRMYLIF